MQLTIELVPKTAWFSNVRSMVSESDWDILRKETYEYADYTCEICDGVGDYHPVECHEIWDYDDKNHIQKLSGLIALCPACHEVKHIGLAITKNRGNIAKRHLARVNGWSMQETDKYVQEQFLIWEKRNRHQWEVDLRWLEKRRIRYKNDRKRP